MSINRKNLIVIITFSIYFLIGISIYKDYGIGIEEHFQRQNGFYWLSQILNFTNLFSDIIIKNFHSYLKSFFKKLNIGSKKIPECCIIILSKLPIMAKGKSYLVGK